MRLTLLMILLALSALMVAPFGAVADELVPQAHYKDWRLFTAGTGADKICTIISEPKSTEPKSIKRGDVFISVSHRPAQQTFNEIAVRVGYPFSAISEPFATIDNQVFKFFSGVQVHNDADETAWLYDLDKTLKMIAAMQDGAALVFKGTSARGTLVIDNYSLFGFTAALAALNQNCPKP